MAKPQIEPRVGKLEGNEITSRLREAMLETADDMRRLGIMDEASHAKIALRQLDKDRALAPAPITGQEIRHLRRESSASLQARSSKPFDSTDVGC